MLRILAKLEKLTKGEVYIKDTPIEKLNFKEDVKAGYVPANPVFFEKKSYMKIFAIYLRFGALVIMK